MKTYSNKRIHVIFIHLNIASIFNLLLVLLCGLLFNNNKKKLVQSDSSFKGQEVEDLVNSRCIFIQTAEKIEIGLFTARVTLR